MKKSFAVVITVLIAVTSALPQSLTLDSFIKAKAVLDRSVAAYGGTRSVELDQQRLDHGLPASQFIAIRAGVLEIWIERSTTAN